MKKFKKIIKALKIRYRRYLLRDEFLIAGAKWFSDRGDQFHRLNYPLHSDSIVFDIGGYIGDFSEDIYKKFGCKIFLFEPVLSSYLLCIKRFENNEKIKCFNFGISSLNEFLKIGVAENVSSFQSPHTGNKSEVVEVKDITEVIKDLKIKKIDLVKINIEGDEFKVIPKLIESGDINKIEYIQIQFHNFVDDAESKRNFIRSELEKTHTEMWSYYFIWESWKLKDNSS
jgi:FkbM family methyltransferase